MFYIILAYLRITVSPGVAGDRFILKQGDDIIFDTGYWSDI